MRYPIQAPAQTFVARAPLAIALPVRLSPLFDLRLAGLLLRASAQ
jgi:hypothetical protein